MSLSSGSCGNCYYLGTSEGGILIDAGVSLRRLKKTLMENGLEMSAVSAILITHDHLDHIRHLGSFCKKLSLPVYTAAPIHGALARHTFTAPTIAPCRRILKEDEWNEVAGMKVRYFVVPHDATQTVGYAIEVAGHKFVIMTDVGRMTDEAVEFARTADTVVLESNYDEKKLESGSYPQQLKDRIRSDKGHLSNYDCAAFARFLAENGTKNFMLGHLSNENNTPDIAMNITSRALAGMEGVMIKVAARKDVTKFI